MVQVLVLLDKGLENKLITEQMNILKTRLKRMSQH